MPGILSRKRFRRLVTVDVIAKSAGALQHIQELVARLERELEDVDADVDVDERAVGN